MQSGYMPGTVFFYAMFTQKFLAKKLESRVEVEVCESTGTYSFPEVFCILVAQSNSRWNAEVILMEKDFCF